MKFHCDETRYQTPIFQLGMWHMQDYDMAWHVCLKLSIHPGEVLSHFTQNI